jgi:predicted RNA-binding protein associated with RNAse of E/G family
MRKPETTIIHYFRPPDRELDIQAELLYQDDEVIVTSHILKGASAPLVVAGQTVIDNGYRAVFAEYRKHWHDVAKVYKPDGDTEVFTGYYTDINTPSEERPDGYWTKDLYLDLWIPPDRSSVTVLDEDEFREAVRNGWITFEEARRAQAELDRLLKLFNRGRFPPKLLERFA